MRRATVAAPVGIAQVAGEHDGGAPKVLNRRQGLYQSVDRSRRDGHLGAFCREPHCDGATGPALARTRDPQPGRANFGPLRPPFFGLAE